MVLNEKQKSSLWMGILTIVAMGVFPPWKESGGAGSPASYAPIFAPPVLASQVAPEIDFSRLLLQCGLVGLVTGGMLATAATAAAAAAANHQVNSNAQKPSSPAPSTTPALAKAKVRTLKFPDDSSIGEVLLESEDDPDYWEAVGAATGLVTVPAGRNIQLEIRKEGQLELTALKQLDPHAIQSLDLSGSAVKDADLAEIVHFNRLNEIDLSDTQITDSGVENIAKIHSLKKIWLDNSKVTDSALKALTALQELQKVSFVGTEVTEQGIEQVKAEFPSKCEIVMASGKVT